MGAKGIWLGSSEIGCADSRRRCSSDPARQSTARQHTTSETLTQVALTLWHARAETRMSDWMRRGPRFNCKGPPIAFARALGKVLPYSAADQARRPPQHSEFVVIAKFNNTAKCNINPHKRKVRSRNICDFLPHGSKRPSCRQSDAPQHPSNNYAAGSSKFPNKSAAERFFSGHCAFARAAYGADFQEIGTPQQWERKTFTPRSLRVTLSDWRFPHTAMHSHRSISSRQTPPQSHGSQLAANFPRKNEAPAFAP